MNGGVTVGLFLPTVDFSSYGSSVNLVSRHQKSHGWKEWKTQLRCCCLLAIGERSATVFHSSQHWGFRCSLPRLTDVQQWQSAVGRRVPTVMPPEGHTRLVKMAESCGEFRCSDSHDNNIVQCCLLPSGCWCTVLVCVVVVPRYLRLSLLYCISGR